jgi:DNA-binding response OmpR family regulator
MRVLLATSNKSGAQELEVGLRGNGHEVVTLSSADQACALEGRFDLGLFAFELDDSSGITLAALLISQSRVAEVRFLYPAENEDERDLASGVTYAITERPPSANVA